MKDKRAAEVTHESQEKKSQKRGKKNKDDKTRFACFRESYHDSNTTASKGMGHSYRRDRLEQAKPHLANTHHINKQRIFSIIIANCYIIQIYGGSEGWLHARINNFLIVHKSFKWNQGQPERPLNDALKVYASVES